MKDVQTARFSIIAFTLVLWPIIIITAEVEPSKNDSQELRQNSTDSEEFYEQFYEWSVWSPCSRTCGIGIKFKGQLCLRENKALCEKKSRTYETCNTQACPQGSKSFRDVQCGQFNGRDIFINGERATWKSYVRGDNQCLLFCYPPGEDLFYYFGRARDGTQCSKEPHGVCVFGRCKPVGCDNRLESGIYLDKCRVCGGNSTTCQPIRGRVERSPTQFERLTGYAELMVIPKGSTSVFLSDSTWNYLALRRQNGAYVVNGNRIINWSGTFKVRDMELQYKRLSNSIGETIQIFGPTSEDLFVTSLLITGKLKTTFEYWKPVRVGKIAEDTHEARVTHQANHSPFQMGWGRWTACSASCGGGIKVRARYPSIKSFREKETEVKKCNVQPCDQMVAAWSEWGSWDDCSATCGGGARIRFRNCKKQGASAKSGCPGKRYEVKLCNVEKCPEEETRPSSIEIESLSTVASSQALHAENTVTRLNISSPVTVSGPNITSAMETFSESSKMPRTIPSHTKTPKIPSSTQLSSQSYSFQHPDISTESSSQFVKQETLSRVEERHSTSSTLNVIRFSELALLESSTKQVIPSFGIDVSTAAQKEMSTTVPSISRGEHVRQQKLSESSVKEKLSLSVSRVTQSTVTSTKLLNTSSKLPGFVYSANNITTTVAIFPTIGPSPISTEDRFATTRLHESPTHPIQSTSLLVTDVAIPSNVLSKATVAIYGSEKRFSDQKPVLVSSSQVVALSSSSLAPFTSHSMDAINTSSTLPYPRISLPKMRYVVTGIFPTPFVFGEKSTVMNSSLPFNVDQTSILGNTKIRSLKPLISLDDPLVVPTRSLRDYKTEEIGTFARNDSLTLSLGSGAEVISLTETSLQRSVQGSPASFYESSTRLKADSTMPLEQHSTFLLWSQTADKSLDPRVTSSLGPGSFSELITGTSILENATEAFSSSPLVSSAIDYSKTPVVISSTKSSTTGQSNQTVDVRILVSSALTKNVSSKRSPSSLKVPSSVSILQTYELPSSPFLAERKAFLVSSFATEGGYIHYTTSASQLQSMALKGETITKHVYSIEKLTSRPPVQSSRSTTKTLKVLMKPQATQITSSLTQFVTKRGYDVYFTTSSYPQLTSPLKGEAMTRASSSQRTQSITVIAETSKLSITHLATHFKQLLSASSIMKPSFVTQGNRLFLPTESSRSVGSTTKEEAITKPLHSLSSKTSMPSTSKVPFTSSVSEENTSLSLSSSEKSSVVTRDGFINLSASTFSKFSSLGEVMTSQMYPLSQQQMLSSISALQASKQRETPLSAELYSLPSLSSIVKFSSVFTAEDRETLTLMDDLVVSSKQVLLSPSPQSSSSLQLEATASLLTSKLLSSSKHEELSPPCLYVSSSPIDSLSSSSSTQHLLLSPFSKYSAAQEVQTTKRYLYSVMTSLERVQSSPSSRFSLALQREGTESRASYVRSSPLTKHIPLSMSSLFSSSQLATKSVLDSSASFTLLKFSSSQKITPVRALLDALKSSSSGQQTGNTIFLQLSSLQEALHTTSQINYQTSLPSIQSSSSSQYIMLSSYIRPSSTLKVLSTASYVESLASLLPRQHLSSVYPRVTSALKVKSTIESLSLPSLQVSSPPKLEITRSRPSPTQHEMAPLSSLPASSVPRVELNTGLMSSFTTSFRKLEIKSSTSLQVSSASKDEVAKRLTDSMKTSLSKDENRSLLPPKASTTFKVAEAISLMNSSRTSSSKHDMQSLASPQFSLISKLDVTTSLMDSIRISLSKYEMQPKASSTPELEVTTSLTDSIVMSLSKYEMQPLLSPKASSKPRSMEAEYTSLRSLSSRQPILSSTAPQLSSALKEDATTSHIESMSTSSFSRKRALSSLSPKFNSVKKDKLSPSRVVSFTSSLTGQYMLLSVTTAQTSKLPTKPTVSKVNSFAIPNPFMSSIFDEEDYTFFTTSTFSLLSPTPTLQWAQNFLISSSSLYTSMLQERPTVDQSVSYERRFTNSLVSTEERHQTVTAKVDAPKIPSLALSKMVQSSLEPASVKVVSSPTPIAVQQEKSTECPSCDLSQRLKEKYCYSDYALLVRIRSEAVRNGNQTSYAAKVRKVYKTNKPIKKKPEIRFTRGSCNCGMDLSMKKVYIVFGKHLTLNGTIGFLEVNRNSFLTAWNDALQEKMEQLEGNCSLNSMIPTPPNALTSTLGAASLSSRSNSQVETPSSRDRTEASTTEPSVTTSAVEEKCGPCEIVIKRTRAYCTSDFVIHVKILSEAVNEFNHDSNYRVRLIHTFKLTSRVTTVRSMWILGNQCRCPLLLPGKHYLLMGRLGVRAGSSEPIAEINRQSYVEVWKSSMIRRLPALKERCPLRTTQSSALEIETTGLTTDPTAVGAVPSTKGPRPPTEKTSSQPPTTQPALTPPVKCRRPCRITKKRNKSYCESDFVIRAKVLETSFNDTLRERKYLVRIIKEFKSTLDLQVREDIYVVNDDCQCPKLEVQEQYIIMGTVEAFSIRGTRLVIPPRPFVWMWKSRMKAGLESITCDN